MANRNKNTKFPCDPDPRMLRAVPAPDEPKKWARSKGSRYCKKLKGDHAYNLDERETNGGISYHSVTRGNVSRRYYFGRDHDEPLRPGEVLVAVDVWLYYLCSGCGKKEYLIYKIDL